ncbi:DUF1254 domain-containing protein [Aquiflexum gelatinilyticum]|uniref:DUF1254 domain-containing protein n=1 Tax=Aquiflexum gelatinilyticum TaxID=2961943 RepID=A0A9X2SYU2_9BACT|nr:DUF1254 domain-containing protein [Aquiflexum gelatinilyticum]MCR9015827.1 DUF1254 domain-containing protein [Aquiflexum gelatinilyticum]
MKINYLPFAVLALWILVQCAPKEKSVTPEEARAIAKEAYIYGFPLVDHYRIFYSYFVDQNDPEFKVSFNQLKNIPKVYTHEDRSVQTANSDTPYSWAGLDLRGEPIVIIIPSIEDTRYFSVQLIDGFTHNFAYIGSRTTGNKGGKYLIAGPDWKGEAPVGFDEVIRSETNMVMALIRTQLFEPDDIDNVIKIQSGYELMPLSAYQKQAAPAQPASITWVKPLNSEEQKSNLMYFNLLNFWSQFWAIHESEKELFERFAKIGVVPGKTFDPESFTPEIKEALAAGMQDAWKEFAAYNEAEIMTGKVGSAEAFGTREHLNNNYLLRMAGAVLGIYGNSKEEALYPIYQTDSDGQPLNASTNKYTLTMQENEMPPVNAFWSYTMYELPSRLMLENPINRYLINSPMLPDLKRNADNSITLYIQYESPGKEMESNWLPAPNGPFFFVNRLYWPKPEAFNGTWKPKPLVRVQ